MTNKEIIEKAYSQAVQGMKSDWFRTSESHLYDYVIKLTPNLRNAYLVVLFDNQMFNGGLYQYFTNGYGQFAKETIDAMIEIGALKKAELLKAALNYVHPYGLSDSVFRESLLKKDFKRLFIGDELYAPLEKLDDKYEALEEETIEELLGKYLRSR